MKVNPRSLILALALACAAAGAPAQAQDPMCRDCIWSGGRCVIDENGNRSCKLSASLDAALGGLSAEQAFGNGEAALALAQTRAAAVMSVPVTPSKPAQSFGPQRGRFRYGSGRCADNLDIEGFNRASVEQVSKTLNGECVDFGAASLNGDDFTYPRLKGWDLRGANLSRARLHFAHLEDADLRGADMGTLSFGYATITGRIDGFTKLPQGRGCRVAEEKDGKRLSCAR